MGRHYLERFLTFITNEAKRYDGFDLRMGANVRDLLHDESGVAGVAYETAEGRQKLRAHLVVACDGRFSRLRKQSQLKLIKTAPPMDVLWFRLPHGQNKTSTELMGRVGNGSMLIVLPRDGYDQVGFVILKGNYRSLRDTGIDAFKKELLAICPAFGDRVNTILEWKQVTPLSVESSRLEAWYQNGLLLIGDAAHVMSPVGGVGINYAIQDAVATANLLGPKLKSGTRLYADDIRLVQQRRELPTRFIQSFQSVVQKRIIRVALDSKKSLRLPWLFRLPLLRRLPAWLIAFGIRPERVRNSEYPGK